jgi:ParB family chromosome partitioning protein
MSEIVSLRPGALAQYDPDKGLKTIAIAKAAESHFARAKNADRLFDAVESKLTAQREYIIWRDSVVSQGQRNDLSPQGDKLPDSDPGRKVAEKWRKKLKSENDFHRTLDDTKERCRQFCEAEKSVRGTEGTGDNEWFTPPQYVERARAVLGTIDLDPASNLTAQETIRATRFFTKEDNGLRHEWSGRVWLNPPYAQPLIAQFVAKLVAERRAERIEAAILLTHNYTDTAWFHEAAETADAICFTRGRIGFYDSDGVIAAPTQGQAFSYFGREIDHFEQTFHDVGFVVPAWRWIK